MICYNIYTIYHGGDVMATINVNVDEKIKEQAKETLDFLGTNFTNVINMLLRQIILTESIPFEIKVPKLNAETIKAIEDAEKGIGLSKGYTNLDEMWKDLEKED
jgi:addiction module antitoxin, relB/dinJ family